MALTLPAKIKDYQDRKFMTLEADDYLFILKEFHRLLRRTLEPSVYTVFCAIEDHAGPGEQIDCPAFSCTASTTTIGKETRNSRTTVYRAIMTLEEMGLVTVEDEGREGRPSIIRPVITSEARAAFLLKGEDINPTCFKLIQVTYPNLCQNETGDMTTRFKLEHKRD
jgi:DNA-binding transcriptional ArsR family regulator